MIINHLGGLQIVSAGKKHIIYSILQCFCCALVCVAMLPYPCLIADDFLCCHGILSK